MRRRPVTKEEREAFEQAVKQGSMAIQKASDRNEKKRPGKHAIATVNTSSSNNERLRKGEREPDARIDLHGLSAAAAHKKLLAFLRSSCARGLRYVLVVTGRGAGAAESQALDLGFDRSPRGVIKRSTPLWLAEPAFREVVAGFWPAHRRHGGDGAIYVHLRKHRP